MAAAYNNYVNTEILAGKLAKNSAQNGGQLKTLIQEFAIAAGDTINSIYRVFKGISADAVIKSIRVFNEAVTGASSVDVGLYEVLDWDGVGAVVDTNVIGSAVNLTSANPITSTPAVLDNAIAIADRGKCLWELAGETIVTKKPAFDICLTMNAMTTGGGAAKICVIMEYLEL